MSNTNQDKIKSINADNDIVNTLLNDVAGEKYYIANDGHGIAGGHSSYNLLKNCRFDENGNVTGFVEQSKLMEEFDSFAQTLTKSMDSMPNNGNVVISKLFGTIAASALSNDGEAMKKIVSENEKYKHISMETAEVIGEMANVGMPKEDEKGEYNVCKAIMEIREEGRWSLLMSMVAKGKISEEDAAEEIGISVEEFQKKMNRK